MCENDKFKGSAVLLSFLVVFWSENTPVLWVHFVNVVWNQLDCRNFTFLILCLII